QHQSGCIAEVFDEVDWAGALRQIPNAVEAQLDVIEFLSGLLHFLDQFEVDDGYSGPGNRFELLDLRIAGRAFLNLSADQLFDSFSACPGPRNQCDRCPDLELRVLTLRHSHVAEDSPETSRDEEHPGHVPGFDAVAGRIMRVVDDVV